MTSRKRGVCLIINNYNFNGKFSQREGTMIDGSELMLNSF